LKKFINLLLLGEEHFFSSSLIFTPRRASKIFLPYLTLNPRRTHTHTQKLAFFTLQHFFYHFISKRGIFYDFLAMGLFDMSVISGFVLTRLQFIFALQDVSPM